MDAPDNVVISKESAQLIMQLLRELKISVQILEEGADETYRKYAHLRNELKGVE